jgi:hypothetical protein
MDSSWDDSTIFEVWGGSIHGESFSGTCLAVAHDCSVVTIDHRFDDILSAERKDVFL